jgi:hypothetical protein
MITENGSQKSLNEVHELVYRSKSLTEVLHKAIEGSDKDANYVAILEMVNEMLLDAWRKIDELVFTKQN